MSAKIVRRAVISAEIVGPGMVRDLPRGGEVSPGFVLGLWRCQKEDVCC